jgi:thiol-disulfide isomerase/thioredoxin
VKLLFLIILFQPFISFGKNFKYTAWDVVDGGIVFEQGLNWRQIILKAKVENKFIFVDCYATWCTPCKEMERSVYLNNNVGKFFNDKFISVKMQMDSSRIDNDTIKRLYSDAHNIGVQHKIQGYPTYLFFTPDGRISDRAMGLKSPDEFISLGNEVIDPSKNYYTLLELFQNGGTNLTQTSFLASRTLLLGDTLKSRQIAKIYLIRLSKDSLFTKNNIEFMREFTKTSADQGFNLFYKHSKAIDSIMGDDIYAEQIVQSIIYQEMVLPIVTGTMANFEKEPDWTTYMANIRAKYGNYYAGCVITAAKCSWALKSNKMPEYTKYLVQFQEKYGSKSNHDMMASLVLNNYAWIIYLNSTNKEELNKALSWSSRAIMMHPSPNWMDTYAHILYKLGRNKESVTWEGIAAKLSSENKAIQSSLEKMQKGEILPIEQ